MKVFFHETFHTFNMDFLNSGKKQVQNIFNIDSSISILKVIVKHGQEFFTHFFYL